MIKVDFEHSSLFSALAIPRLESHDIFCKINEPLLEISVYQSEGNARKYFEA